MTGTPDSHAAELQAKAEKLAEMFDACCSYRPGWSCRVNVSDDASGHDLVVVDRVTVINAVHELLTARVAQERYDGYVTVAYIPVGGWVGWSLEIRLIAKSKKPKRRRRWLVPRRHRAV